MIIYPPQRPSLEIQPQSDLEMAGKWNVPIPFFNPRFFLGPEEQLKRVE
jgi:hypothetical protein